MCGLCHNDGVCVELLHDDLDLLEALGDISERQGNVPEGAAEVGLKVNQCQLDVGRGRLEVVKPLLVRESVVSL